MVKCEATTKKGTRCKRNASGDNPYCKIHNKMNHHKGG